MQIRQVVSEQLQATIRRLLPSQQGFTEDLQASNVIQPIIDLTPSAEGSSLPVDLARSFSLGNITHVSVGGTGSATIVNSPGFYRVLASFGIGTAAATGDANLNISDGLSTKRVFAVDGSNIGTNTSGYPVVDINIFLDTGETLSVGTGSNISADVTAIPIADKNGNITNPAGFSFQ